MSFFTLSDGQAVEQTNTFDAGGQDFEPIPNNTQVKAIVDDALWAEYEGDRYINIKWQVADGEFQGRIIFQKIRVGDADPKKKDKAIRMLAAIDTNAGGKLQTLGHEPSDMDLQMHLSGKMMALLLKVWNITDKDTGEKKAGNWIGAVSPLNGATTQRAPVQVGGAQQAQPQTQGEPDIGF